jgi:hypothetical protein
MITTQDLIERLFNMVRLLSPTSADFQTTAVSMSRMLGMMLVSMDIPVILDTKRKAPSKPSWSSSSSSSSSDSSDEDEESVEPKPKKQKVSVNMAVASDVIEVDSDIDNVEKEEDDNIPVIRAEASASVSSAKVSTQADIRVFFNDADFVPVDPFTLKENQIPTVEKAVISLRTNHRFSDESNMGAGKTVTAVEIGHRMKLPILVIGPSGTMEKKWRNTARRQGVPIVDYISHARLRGATEPTVDDVECPLTHPWLTRSKYILTHRKNRKTGSMDAVRVHRYKATRAFLDLTSRGVLLVVDEAQAFKNASLQSKAMAALTDAIFGPSKLRTSLSHPTSGDSCLLTLSATLMDKPEHAERMLQTFGLLPAEINTENRLWVTSNVYDRGFTETSYDATEITQRLVNLCMQLDRATESFYRNHVLNYTLPLWRNSKTGLLSRDHFEGSEEFEISTSKERTEWYIYFLFVAIIRKHIAGATAVNKTNDGVKRFYFNLRARMDRMETEEEGLDSREQLNNALRQIQQIEQDIKTGKTSAEEGKKEIGELTRSIEAVKAGLFVRLAKDALQKDPNSKVVVYLNLLSTVDFVEAKLGETFVVGRLTGSVHKIKREETLTKFAAPVTGNDKHDMRVIVATVQAAGQGIDLHDTTGLYPRTTFMSPNHLFMTMQQATGRTDRVGVKGVIRQNIVFAASGSDAMDNGLDEQDMMAKTHEKSTVLRSTASQQQEDGVQFLDNFVTMEEKEDGTLAKVDKNSALLLSTFGNAANQSTSSSSSSSSSSDVLIRWSMHAEEMEASGRGLQASMSRMRISK